MRTLLIILAVSFASFAKAQEANDIEHIEKSTTFAIGQTNRVFLNLATTYPTNRMATEIKQYFEANNEAFEVLIAVGKKMVSVERYMVSERNFYKEFRKRIEQ